MSFTAATGFTDPLSRGQRSGYWQKVVPPPHEHQFPDMDIDQVGIGSIWVCKCAQPFVYTGQVDGLFRPATEADLTA